MIKIGCVYTPKVTRMPMSEYPKHVQVAEMGNTFYRFLAKKDLTDLAKLPKKFPDFEITMKLNRFITHKYQFHYNDLRDKALETMEKMKSMANQVKCNKFLIITHYTQEYDEAFFKNVYDFFNSVDLNGFNLFWEIRGMSWRDKEILPKLEKLFIDLNIGHVIDLLFSKPINFIQEGIAYTRLHGFGARWNNYLFKQDELIRLIEEINKISENNKEIYVIFATEEKYNDANFFKKLLDEIGEKTVDLETFQLPFRNDFVLNYSYAGLHLNTTYSPPFAISTEKDKIKISTKVQSNMHNKLDDYVKVVNTLVSSKEVDRKLEKSYFEQLRKLGEYLRKYLLGDKVNYRYRLTRNNNVIIEVDETSLNFPYEWIYDGRDFACMKNNLIRKIVQNGESYPLEVSRSVDQGDLRVLVLNRTQDETSNEMLANFKPAHSEIKILTKGGRQDVQNELEAGYDIIVYLGPVESEEGEPALRWVKSLFPLSELLEKMKTPPKLFYIGNVIQQKKMVYSEESFGYAIPFVKGGCNFLTNFVTLSREQIVEFITEFYHNLLKGEEIALALKNTRRRLFERYWGINPSWMSFSLFGDENFKIEGGW